MADKTVSPEKKTAGYKRETKSITLKLSGKVVTFEHPYTTREFIAAQNAAGKNARSVPVYLIQAICQFDGAKMTAGEIHDNLPGPDYAQLVGEIFAESDDEGNG